MLCCGIYLGAALTGGGSNLQHATGQLCHSVRSHKATVARTKTRVSPEGRTEQHKLAEPLHKINGAPEIIAGALEVVCRK